MAEKPILYFICTGNSCRSQMAEGFGKEVLGDNWDVRSAGIEAHGLNPKAVEMMDEVGVDISNQESSTIDLDALNRAELVITLCGDARDNCPTLPPNVQSEHWGLVDPAKAEGTEAEVNQVFRDVRDDIKSRIKELK
ncbi:arsenate reductase (thioredoxin) [Tenuibacillus multivorans]|uniref:Arsenate reductase n=1 Tax=Tenuibacillus multivorans TaxID=237069 RepID=A0A1H0B6X5_9BACI|nr:arsenate reductase (thioredoxin) [Tenuibacillus multivorans]GEL78617.1 protein ArsC [Tenuibacillus multivorans]SDN41435.1 arsenate reductase [Tenuibacillus multivorans]